MSFFTPEMKSGLLILTLMMNKFLQSSERNAIEQYFRISQEKPEYYEKWECLIEEAAGNCELQYLALHPE